MGSVDPSQHTFWTQRVRNSETGMVADSARGSVISPPYQRIVDVQSVVLDDRWDAVIVLGDFDDAPLPGVVGDAEIWGWLWKRINTPGNVAAQVSGNTVTLTWTNQHRGRSLDGTIIHRYQNGTRYLAVLAGAGDSTFLRRSRPGCGATNCDTARPPSTTRSIRTGGAIPSCAMSTWACRRPSTTIRRHTSTAVVVSRP
jgi:hypothetical protein